MLADVFALAGMLPFIYIEAVTFVEYGPTRWVALRSNSLRTKWVCMPGSSQGPLAPCCRWLNIWNAMDLIAYVLQASSRHIARALGKLMFWVLQAMEARLQGSKSTLWALFSRPACLQSA